MAFLMVRMKLRMLSRSDGGWWRWRTWIGLAIAAATLLTALDESRPLDRTGTALLLTMIAWTIGWIVAPIQTGGASTDVLQPIQFALLPTPRRKLLTGFLVAAFVGKLPIVTAIAFLLHAIYGARFGAVPGILGVVVGLAMVVLVLLLSRVAIGATGRALRTRIGLEFAAVQFALLIALSSGGWLALSLFAAQGGFAGDPLAINDTLRTVLLWLPPGWGLAAVEGAASGAWLEFIVAVAAIGGAIALLLVVWSRQLASAMVLGGDATRAEPVTAGWTARLPRTATGAALARGFLMWRREPRVALEFRVALLTGIFTALLPLIADSRVLLPWAGVIAAVFASVCAANLYGLEGTAFWITLAIPGGARRDVEAKVGTYLVLFLPATVILTVVGGFAGGASWVWPWTMSLTIFAVLIGAGLAIEASWRGAVPVPAAARRSGDLMASADNAGPAYAVFLGTMIGCAPIAAILGGSWLLESTVLAWIALPVAVVLGTAICQWCVRDVARGLDATGPELLDILRHGRRASPRVPKADEGNSSTLTGWRQYLANVCYATFWIPLAQAIAPTAFKVFDVDVASWFVAPRLPGIWQWPWIGFMYVLAAVLILLPGWMARRAAQGGPSAPRR